MERICKNCGSLVYEHKKYCADCGAKWIENRITMRSVFSDFTDMYIGLDTRFVRTFLDLFKRPEAVIRGFINGRRMGYVDAIRYLFISLFFSGIFIFLLNTYSQVAITLAPLNLIVIYFFKDIYIIWSNVPLLTMLVFNAYVYKRLFKLSLPGIIGKSLLFLFWTIVTFIVIVISAIILGFLGALIYKKFINPAWDPSSLVIG